MWDWGRRPAAGHHSRGPSLGGQGAGGKGQPREMPAPGPLGAAAGLSTKVRLKRDIALVLQAAAAIGNAGARESSLHRPQRSWEAPTEGRGRSSLHPNPSCAGGAGPPRPARGAPPRPRPRAASGAAAPPPPQPRPGPASLPLSSEPTVRWSRSPSDRPALTPGESHLDRASLRPRRIRFRPDLAFPTYLSWHRPF